eukprot:s1333_g10.t1
MHVMCFTATCQVSAAESVQPVQEPLQADPAGLKSGHGQGQTLSQRLELFAEEPSFRESSGAVASGASAGDADATPELDGMVILAMKSQKERNFLLKLESHIINNLQSGTIERIKLNTPLPPKLRKLVHMVSDYFGLGRTVRPTGCRCDMIVDKEEGEEKKATMTLLKTEKTRVPARTLALICTELDDEELNLVMG